jgi:hypothetical protein
VNLVAPPLPAAVGPDAGVISDARRRQRRRRAGVAVVLAALAATALLTFLTARTPPPLRLSSSLARLVGPPLGASTRLQLAVAPPFSGPVELVDVDSRLARVVAGLGLPVSAVPGWGPSAWLTPSAGGALAAVHHQACQRCSASETDFLIGYGGSVRRFSSRPLTRREATAPALGSPATWLLSWPDRGGSCTLRLVPSTRAAVLVPCGDPQAESPAGIVLWRAAGLGSASTETLVDPLTGRVRARAPQLVPLSYRLVLAMSDPEPLSCQRVKPHVLRCSQSFRQRLRLLDLSSGTSRALRWPGAPTGFAIADVIPEPHGALAAVEFVDAVTDPAGAADVWLLDTRSGRFTHVPGFPALENVKASSVSWTGDGRLVVASEDGARAVVGVWRPGAGTMPVHPLPALTGYSNVVALIDPRR